MKQIEECLDRVFLNKKPLKKKWRARLHPICKHWLYLYHHNHLILIYDLRLHQTIYEWWQTRADRNGLRDAQRYLDTKQYERLSAKKCREKIKRT